jgi:hypothetical protein
MPAETIGVCQPDVSNRHTMVTGLPVVRVNFSGPKMGTSSSWSADCSLAAVPGVAINIESINPATAIKREASVEFS